MDETAQFAAVRRLFDAVCDLPPAEREAQLLAASEPEPVKQQVRALLARELRVTASDLQAVAAGLSLLSGQDELPPGTVLGAWTLTGQIGAGGMGTVYAAHRSDGHFEQRAAVKLLRGLASPAALRYLARERQILASLAHPNIARLLDGGSTRDGQPYLVMEYLDARPIDRYCQDEGLALPAILALLLQVCDAVSFAHARLIVHCDLKPSNILVGRDGRPQLLDFGIARLIGGDEPDGRPGTSSQRVRAFTPGFASPEQEAGGEISTAADVYSLGRLLDVLAGPQLARAPELQAVVRRACAQAPTDRYESVAALREDLQRYLRREPLTALPPTTWYRTRKWLQRRWPLALAASLFLLTVSAFTLQLRADRDRARAAQLEAQQERDRATQAERSARQVSDFLVAMLDGANPDAGGAEVPVSTLVEQALQRIDRDLEGQPAVQSELYATLARVQRELGQPEQARVGFEKAVALARKLDRPLVLAQRLQDLSLWYRQNLRSGEAVSAAREAVDLLRQAAPGSDDLLGALLMLGAAWSQDDRLDEAESALTEAVRMAEAPGAAAGRLPEALEALSLFLSTTANQPERAEAPLRRALALRAAQTGNDGATLGTQERLGALLGRLRRLDEAEVLLRGALAQRQALSGEEDVDIPWRMSELATILTQQGKLTEALGYYQQSVALAERKIGRNSGPYAVLMNNLALATMRVGDYAGSERRYREALAIAAAQWGAESPALATLRFNLATLLAKLRPREALPLVRQAEQGYAARLPAAHADVVTARLLLADVCAQTGAVAEARDWLAQVAAAQPSLTPQLQADQLQAQAQIAAADGDLDRALDDLTQAEALRAEALGANDSRVWLTRILRAEWLARRAGEGDPAASRALAQQILAQLDGVLVADSPERARLRRLLH
ncbi:MAG: serine/threonine-protein kinase [Lysobacterales bacterium]